MRVRPRGDVYPSMTALLRAEELQNYCFEIREPDSEVAVLAPHGGKIEWGTNQIATLIAGDDFKLFCFNGNRVGGETFRYLHVTSDCYDEERCQRIVASCGIIVAIHGWNEEEKGLAPNIYLGGRDEKLRETIGHELRDIGFRVADFADPTNRFRGQRSANICNLGKTGKGVQLELPRALRRELVLHNESPSPRLYKFVEALRRSISIASRIEQSV